MTNPRRNVPNLLLILALLVMQSSIALAQAPLIQAEVLETHPHDRSAFTQGLVFVNGRLFESTGLYSRSQLRELNPRDMTLMQAQAVPGELFAEGLAGYQGQLFQLTWKAGRLLRYGLDELRALPEWRYQGEGWGLTTQGDRLLMSDGTDLLLYRSPDDFSVTGQLRVTDAGKPVTRLNELEWVQGMVWANIWREPVIAIIDPASGLVRVWLDLSRLAAEQQAGADVANGIAWLPGSDRVLVTGKFWSRLYAIKIPDLP